MYIKLDNNLKGVSIVSRSKIIYILLINIMKYEKEIEIIKRLGRWSGNFFFFLK
jgi:hypothetical protein